MKELAKDAEREKALKDVAKANAKEKTKAAAATEKKDVASEKARSLAEKRSLELETKLGKTELKLAKTVSWNTVQARSWPT